MAETGGPARKKPGLMALLAGAAVLVLAVFGIGMIYMGVFDVAGDRPHTKPVAWLMQTVRDRSIAVRAQGVVVPSNLGDTTRVKRGAAEYGEMCAMCHLGPGVERSEISQGLYPRAPELAGGTKRSVAEQFWIVKHGLKMTAMPAWGVTHDDAILWDVVAFLQKLPGLTPDQYRALTRDAAEEHEMMGGHGHDMPKSMPGMNH
jgi:mono/diheme cytochrome c family protein